MISLLLLPLPAGLIGSGFTLLIQALGDDLTNNIGNLVGGSVLMVVGVVALRMVLTAAKHERDTFAAIDARRLGYIEELEGDNVSLRSTLAKVRLELDRERRLRVALEASGLTERRHYPPEEDPAL